MCGILAFYSISKTITRNDLICAINTMKHRGPDGTGTWLNANKNVGLAHTRLSVVGIRNGQQPLKTYDESIICVVNGEFYGYREIKNKLIKKNYVFFTESDSEVLLALYQEYGLKFFNYLNGEFAFILFDTAQNKLIIGRDRFGAKPLYYCLDKSTLYVASEIKAILKMGIRAKWNDYAVLNYCHGIPNEEETCFENIYCVKPGHYIIAKNGNISEHKYWDFSFQKNSNELYDKQEYIKKFRFLFEESINKRLIADTSIGCYLSGGIDSSSILAIASKKNMPIKAFTISFEERSIYDEQKFAKILSDHLNIDLLILKIKQSDLSLNYKKTIYYEESLIYQTNGIGKYLLSKFSKENNIKSVLTGEGADEILAGYPSFKEDYIAQCGFTNKYEKIYPELSIYKQKIGYIPAFLKLGCEISYFCNLIINDDFREFSNLSLNPFENFILKLENIISHVNSYVNKSTYMWSKSLFPKLILSSLGDRMEMSNSIEGRLPFLDNELVDFSLKLPMNLKINNKLTEKHILRESVKHELPFEIYSRNKHMYTSPPISGKNIENSEIFKQMLEIFSDKEFKQSRFFDQKKTIALLGNLKNLDQKNAIIAEFALHLALSSYFLTTHYFNESATCSNNNLV